MSNLTAATIDVWSVEVELYLDRGQCAEVPAQEGRETMVKTARTSPAVVFATCARLIGPEVKVND